MEGRVILQSAFDQTSVLYEVTCTVPGKVSTATEGWLGIPVRKIYVVEHDAIRPLEGYALSLPQGENTVADLRIYFKVPDFINAYAETGTLPNGRRRWRKEFRIHAVTHKYHIPEEWNQLSYAQVDKLVSWVLQDVACAIRAEFPNARYRVNEYEQGQWNTRFAGEYMDKKSGYSTLLAHMLFKAQKACASRSCGRARFPSKEERHLRAERSIQDFKQMNGEFLHRLYVFCVRRRTLTAAMWSNSSHPASRSCGGSTERFL